MCASIRRQVPRIGSLTALPKLAKVLLRLQILLAEANLSELATVAARRSLACPQHTIYTAQSIVRYRLHAVRRVTIHVHRWVAWRRWLSTSILLLVPWGHSLAPRRHHLLMMIRGI